MPLISWTAKSCALSDIGLKRQNNEDVFASHPDSNFYALADGMGGHQAGEIAAKLAVERLSSAFIHSLSDVQEKTHGDLLLGKLTDAVQEANSHVYEMANAHRDWSGMGTTLSCIFLHEQALLYAHVGDSRIYRLRGELKQLTEDHSLRKDPASKYKNKLTRAIGTCLFVDPEVGILDLQPGDIYLLCSDGLTDHVPDDKITSLLQSDPSISKVCQSLVEAAKADGGFDNITVLIIKILAVTDI